MSLNKSKVKVSHHPGFGHVAFVHGLGIPNACTCLLVSAYHPAGCRYVKKWQEMVPVSSIFMQLSTTVCVMLMFAHVAACMLVLVAKLEGMPEGSWMVQYGMMPT